MLVAGMEGTEGLLGRTEGCVVEEYVREEVDRYVEGMEGLRAEAGVGGTTIEVGRDGAG